MNADALVKALLEDEIDAFLGDTKAAFDGHMEERRILTYLETVTEESAANGEAESNDEMSDLWDEFDMDSDDSGSPEEVAGSAASALRMAGVSEASSSDFHPGVWYTCQQESVYEEGRAIWTQRSYHLKNFTEEEERRIYDILKQGKTI